MKKWFIVATAILLLCVTYLQFHGSKKPLAPKTPVVSSCKELKPGMKRIGGRLGFQFDVPVFKFDVPVKDFTIREGSGDETDVSGFPLTRGNSRSYFSWGSERLKPGSAPIDPALVFSGPVEKRKIFDDNGKQIGEDSWGYLDNGEYWRRVRLVGWVVAGYGSINEKDVASSGSVHEEDAELFDRVISSVCILSTSGS